MPSTMHLKRIGSGQIKPSGVTDWLELKVICDCEVPLETERYPAKINPFCTISSECTICTLVYPPKSEAQTQLPAWVMVDQKIYTVLR